MERGHKIAPLAVLEHGVAQIACGEDALRQARDLSLFLFYNFIKDSHSSSSFTPCMRFAGQPARNQPFTNGSRSPSITACTLLVSTPVRRSFTMRYGWKT